MVRSSGLVSSTCAHFVPGMLKDFEALVAVMDCMAACSLMVAKGMCV